MELGTLGVNRAASGSSWTGARAPCPPAIGHRFVNGTVLGYLYSLGLGFCLFALLFSEIVFPFKIT